MKIRINIDEVGQKIDDLIESKLESKGFPKCMGSMIPPLIERQVEMEETKVLHTRDATHPDDIIINDVSKIVNADAKYYDGKIIKNEGVSYINTYKNNLSDLYVNQLFTCSSCAYAETCYKLTRNYLKLLDIQEKVKLREILKSRNN